MAPFQAALALAATVVLAALPNTAADSDLTLTPIRSGTPVGMIFVQGAQCPTKAYEDVAKAIQLASPLALYITIPAFPLDVAEPVVLNSGMERSLSNLYGAGLKKTDPVFVGGHSLGGAMVQDWTFKQAGKIKGQVLMGATLLRKYRNGTMSTNYPVSTMMMSGTLDGLLRVTRQAESYYHYGAKPTFPVVIFEGMSHWSFAGGTPPGNVLSNDLKPEIDSDTAHATIGRAIAQFFDMTLSGDAAATAAIKGLVATSGKISAPITASQVLEAFVHLQGTCNSDHPLPDTCPFYPRYPNGQTKGSNSQGCVCGTPWSSIAQNTLAGGDLDGHVATVDAVHPVSDINPIHLPHIWNTCAKPAGCTLNTTTVTYPIYSTLDSFDTGFYPTSASELRTKLKSRQSLLLAAGNTNVNFTATDVVPSLCADINKKSWAWALGEAGPVAAQRFAKIGQPMAFGQDIYLGNAGPVWIENPIEYKASHDKSVLNVYSPCSHTPVDYPISSAAGFHYCKLVSPARALEHIYIDGLRPKGSLKPHA